MAKVCKRVTYSGRVQGVGFRCTARQIAAGFEVAGYVRNLSNGDVELVAEGEESAVASFLDSVADRMRGYIQSAAVSNETACGHRSFVIRH
jgi:acylphosphatase